MSSAGAHGGGGATEKRPPPAKKSLGQHFLVDRRVLGAIVDAAEVSANDVVVEIGPGRGALTKLLAERAGRLVAVEVDAVLAELLREKYAEHPGVSVLVEDARELDIDAVVPESSSYKVVANLPYYAASPIVRRFLEADRKPELMVVTVQREVAREMAAAPGKMGLLSVAVQLYGRPRIVATVQPRAFRPAPKVTSAVVRIDVYPQPAVAFDSEREFFRVVRAGFSARRKQLHNCLKKGLHITPAAARDLLIGADIDPTRRAQTLSLPEWGQLYEAFRSLEAVAASS
jgi:16S rRNA (adenine1518-N6/adenine1519-N6)-dimethyltransferase